MLEFKTHQEKTRAVIALKGGITVDVMGDLRTELKRIIGGGIVSIVLDFSAIDAVDSSGVGLLASLHNTLAPKAGKLEITGVSADLFAFFSDMRLHKHFSIVPKA
jgi:serine/threonine-protein kinase RsbW